MSSEKRAFSVSWASWNRQKCPEIVLKFSKNLVLKVHFLLLGALGRASIWPIKVAALASRNTQIAFCLNIHWRAEKISWLLRSQVCIYWLDSICRHRGNGDETAEHLGPIPWRPQTMTATNHDGHKPWRPQTMMATNHDGHKPWRPHTLTTTATAMKTWKVMPNVQLSSFNIAGQIFTKLVVMVCGRHGFWRSWFVAIMVCGRHGLWPSWFVAVMVCGHHGLWPSWFVAVMVCGRRGLWLSWCRPSVIMVVHVSLWLMWVIWWTFIQLVSLHYVNKWVNNINGL